MLNPLALETREVKLAPTDWTRAAPVSSDHAVWFGLPVDLKPELPPPSRERKASI